MAEVEETRRREIRRKEEKKKKKIKKRKIMKIKKVAEEWEIWNEEEEATRLEEEAKVGSRIII